MVQDKGNRERCNGRTVLHAQSTSALSSGFPLSQGNAEALGRWGGKTKRRLIFYVLSNTSAKNYRNRIVYVNIIASQMWDVFSETQCIDKRHSDRGGTARRSTSVEVLSTAAHLYEKLHSKRLTIGEWPWKSLKVIENGAIRWRHMSVPIGGL